MEGLRSQLIPDEPLTAGRYEILHRFMNGFSDPVLQWELTLVYATEAFLTDPPTVESLRFTVQELRRRRHQQQHCNTGCTESVPYQSRKGEHVPTATSYQCAHGLKSACPRRKVVVHSAEEPHIHGPESKPQQVNPTATSEPAPPEKSCITEIFADCPTSSVQTESSSPRADVK